MNDDIKKLLDTCKNADDAMKNPKMAKEIRKIAGTKDSLNDFLSEEGSFFNEPPISDKTNDAKSKTSLVEFSIMEYVEISTRGFTSSVEEFVDKLFIDKQTIIHCKDNNVKYSFQQKTGLIEYIKQKQQNKIEIL